jgi:hypothetical protein
MSSSDNFANQKDSGGLLKIFFIRAPKKNHDALAKIGKQTDDFFSKHGVPKYGYRLNSRENMMDFVMYQKPFPLMMTRIYGWKYNSTEMPNT